MGSLVLFFPVVVWALWGGVGRLLALECAPEALCLSADSATILTRSSLGWLCIPTIHMQPPLLPEEGSYRQLRKDVQDSNPQLLGSRSLAGSALTCSPRQSGSPQTGEVVFLN